jgi:hypothetical protein
MEPLKSECAGIIMTGDLNAPPHEKLHGVFREFGFTSTHEVPGGGGVELRIWVPVTDSGVCRRAVLSISWCLL